eukprot:TRINITY_DN22091_c0_g1_i1.p2 TRINITY_DN22091_c0_g1~~TRINITY_DN22091_c0_g1_i1.p2  ORF type:complete len:117 (-),score=13.77 TRINITY_DN22091_c0_g1_i1:380-730(-)
MSTNGCCIHLLGPLPLNVVDKNVVGAAHNHHKNNNVIEGSFGTLHSGTVGTDGNDLHHSQQAHTDQAQCSQKGLSCSTSWADQYKESTQKTQYNTLDDEEVVTGDDIWKTMHGKAG